MTDETVRAAGYVRVSTQEQAEEGLSLAVQESRIQAYAASKGWRYVRTFRDPGASGLDTNRDGYQEMIAARRTYDAIVFVRLDRLHRNRRNLDDFVLWAKANGKHFASLDLNLDTSTAIGEFVLVVMAAIAQLESHQISERVLPSMEAAKDAGLHQGRCPVGFVFVRGDEGEGLGFLPTKWGQALREQVPVYGIDEARKRNPYPHGKNAGKAPSRTTAYRILENFRLYEQGLLSPNRNRTPVGTHSKFSEAPPSPTR